MDVVENEFLLLNCNGDCGVPSVEGNVLLKAIMVDIAKWLFGTTCEESDLHTGNVLLDEKLPYSCGTVDAFKEAKAAGDFSDLLAKVRVIHTFTCTTISPSHLFIAYLKTQLGITFPFNEL